MMTPIVDTQKIRGTCPKHGEWSRDVTSLFGVVVGANPENLCPFCHAEAVDAHKKKLEAELRESVEREREYRRIVAQRRHESNLKRAAIPPEYADKTLDAYRPQTAKCAESFEAAKKWMANFQEISKTGTGLFFYGGTGTGKSHIACAILRELLRQTDGFYCTAWDVIRAVRSAPYGVDALAPFCEASVLVLDEIGVQNGTRSEEVILYPVIEARKNANKPTIFISNVQPDAPDDFEGLTVKKIVGARIWDRIQSRSIFLRYDGESYRKRFATVDDLLASLEA